MRELVRNENLTDLIEASKCLFLQFGDIMFFYMQPPVMIVATLLPYRGIIISDGLVSSMPISFGGGIKKQFKDCYNSAKAR